jgi:hypothetical protein
MQPSEVVPFDEGEQAQLTYQSIYHPNNARTELNGTIDEVEGGYV